MTARRRPENWENPYEADRDYFNEKYGNNEGDSCFNRDIAAYEAGADAMLEALRVIHSLKGFDKMVEFILMPEGIEVNDR